MIASFDVAIVPHQINNRTRGNDLLKVMDYLAAGPPVVATPCSGLEALSPPVILAHSADEFIRRVRDAMDSQNYESAPGKAIAQSRSWSKIVGDLAPWRSSSAVENADRPALV